MKKLNNSNILKLEDVIKSESNYFMILEYAPNGDLLDLITKEKRVSFAANVM